MAITTHEFRFNKKQFNTASHVMAYFEAIKPYQDMLNKIYSIAIPTITVFFDGRIEYDYNFTEAQKETIRLIHEVITLAKIAHGFDA